MDKIMLGRIAEEAAAEYLIQQGYTIIERNCRFANGEIDIIAEHLSDLVFVEVRSRQGIEYGLPQETVNYKKQQKLRKLANQYLVFKKTWQRACRFDVVGIIFGKEGRIETIDLITNAF